MTDRYPFKEDYQDLLLATLCQHQDSIGYLATALKPAYFSGVYSTLTAKCALDYYAAQNRFPTFIVLAELVREKAAPLNPSDADLAQTYVQKLATLDTSDYLYIRDTIVKFAQERALVDAIRKSVELLKEDKVPDDGFSTMFAEAMRVGTNLDDLGYVLHADADRVIDKVTDVRYGIPTGYPLLDRIWRHGWGPGWLIVPLAPPKRYKTAFCINLAMNMVSPAIGDDVFYYACELNQELAMVRAMCHLARLPDDYLYDSKEKFRKAVKSAMQDKVAGNLLFKSFASKGAKISDIRAHARTAISQLKLRPKAMFIDYAETVMPSDKRDPEYRQQANIYVEARALGSEFNCPVIMPDRCNKETVDKDVPDMKGFQGSFEKAGVTDVAIGLCSTEEEYRDGIIRFFNFINRHGRAYQHLRGKVDPQTWQVEIHEQIPFEPDSDRKRRKGPSLPAELL
jgi:replicative DNA helicase